MATQQKRILVYLANGTQGGAVARQAIARGHIVRALVRDPARSDHLASLGIEVFQGDLQSSDNLIEAHRGIDYVVLQMPLGPPAKVASLMENALVAIKANHIEGVVTKMASAHPSIPTDEPSFVANQVIFDRMRDSGLRFSVIRPTMYLDNLLRPGTRVGIATRRTIVYPLPTTRRVAWTSTKDAANAALTLIENGAFGVDRLVSGSEAVDGDGLALRFSRALQREIGFQSLSLDAFEEEVDSMMSKGMGKRVSSKLRFFENHPDEADRMLSLTFEPAPDLSGFTPTSIEDWVSGHRSSFTDDT
jgi:uncharacterized protein YbjT (DUF2867 family)